MSDMIKSENESMNREQYKVTYQAHTTVELSSDVTAPAGSFAWAIIQLNLGNLVCRKDWDSAQKRLRLNVHEGYISEPYGSANWKEWLPEYTDMVAHDWMIWEEKKEEEPAKPELASEYNIVFDITPIEYAASYSGNTSAGNLVTIETDMMNDPISDFHFNKDYDSISMGLNSSLENNMELLADIRAKQLTMTVDGTQYDMGSPLEKPDWPQPLYFPHYKGKDVVKVGELLKQTGKTLRFHLNWHA